MITVSGHALGRAIRRVNHARLHQERHARPILDTIHLELYPVGWLRLVAADNYRLAVADVLIEPTEAGPPYEFGPFNLMGDDVARLLAFLPTDHSRVQLETRTDVAKGPTIVLTVPGVSRSITLRGMDGTYPAYAQIIAEKGPTGTPIAVNIRYLREVGGRTAKGDHVHFGDTVTVTVGRPDRMFVVADEKDHFTEYIMPVRQDPKETQR